MKEATTAGIPSLVAARAAKDELARREMSKQALADGIGMTLHSVECILCGSDASRRCQRRIEAFLRQSFWTSPEVFAERLPMIDHFGIDIDTMTGAELQELWRKVTGKRQVRRKRALLLALLREHFTAATAAQQPQKKQ